MLTQHLYVVTRFKKSILGVDLNSCSCKYYVTTKCRHEQVWPYISSGIRIACLGSLFTEN